MKIVSPQVPLQAETALHVNRQLGALRVDAKRARELKREHEPRALHSQVGIELVLTEHGHARSIRCGALEGRRY